MLGTRGAGSEGSENMTSDYHGPMASHFQWFWDGSRSLITLLRSELSAPKKNGRVGAPIGGPASRGEG